MTEPTRLVTNVTKPTISIFRPAKEKDTGAAVLIRRWHTRHPDTLPYAPRSNVPEINLSRIPVGGDVAGLMFAAGSVAVVIIGVPDMAWYFVSALICAAVLAWALFAYRAAHVRRELAARPLGLF